MTDNELRDTAILLIPEAGKGDLLTFEAISGGGNNRLYKIFTKKGRYILKYYFRHKDDKRDRLSSEYIFCSFAWNHGIRCVAMPVVMDRKSSIGIYSFIEGKKLQAGDVTWNEVLQALNFFTELNHYRTGSDAGSLSDGAEACFSIEDHIKLVEHRVDRLMSIEIKDDVDREAYEFISNDLVHKWSEINNSVVSVVNALGVTYAEKIPIEDMVISPSDFGFHNAIQGDNGKIYFIDFEYAGWDDPAKVSGDFFSQVAVPVPVEYFQRFIEAVAECTSNKGRTIMRMKLLLPVYRIKWCCILLNHFLRAERERKRFADQNATEKKSSQLAEAKSLLNSVDALQFSGGFI
jgi:thiamine kinase-like enzyme